LLDSLLQELKSAEWHLRRLQNFQHIKILSNSGWASTIGSKLFSIASEFATSH